MRTIRIVHAGEDDVATGEDETTLIFADASSLATSLTKCIAGMAFEPGRDDQLVVSDRCTGYVIRLQREILP